MDGELDLDALIARINAMSPEEREQARKEAHQAVLDVRSAPGEPPSDEEIVRIVKEVRAEMRAETERAAAGRR